MARWIKNRIELAQYFEELGFIEGAEIGVCDGRYSEILRSHVHRVWAIDNWESRWRSVEQAARDRLGNEAIIKLPSVQAADKFAEESLDFVFIDANHSYEAVKEDIEAWTPKVKPGGIVSGHDYYLTRHGNYGVIEAVNEYVDKHGYVLQFTRWDLDGHEDDKQPCWYFKKEIE